MLETNLKRAVISLEVRALLTHSYHPYFLCDRFIACGTHLVPVTCLTPDAFLHSFVCHFILLSKEHKIRLIGDGADKSLFLPGHHRC